ncbi:MAG: hypothetical protein FJ290_33125, partial [Planctomycetes bacterium]|nr:hypothetical protein [Planctomycetota bacterium]
MNEILGLHYAIWIVVILYFIGMLALGWWSKHEAKGREGFLLGKRQFGVPMMVMHAFGAGTHPGDVTGVMSATVKSGASGIWVSWMWMFGTPFYWLIAPIIRRMRCLTLADYFEERFGKAATILYVVMATIGMTVATASMLLATSRTVQGMMGKAEVAEVKPAAPAQAETAAAEAAKAAEEKRPEWAARGLPKGQADMWFYGILLVTTAVFLIYSYWGGIIAAIRTDFVQGLMIIALSFLAIPAALRLPEVLGWTGAVHKLAGGWECDIEGEKFTLTGLGQEGGKSRWRLDARGETLPIEMPAGSTERHAWALEAKGEKVLLAARRDASGVTHWELEAKGEKRTLRGLGRRQGSYLSLFDPTLFSLSAVLVLCISAPISMLAQPHLMTVCGAGKTEWEGRMGFTYGNVLKRVCTMGWCILALVWLVFLFETGERVEPDAAFGDSVRALLSPVLQGLMLACVMAAGMSTGSAIQVTVAGLFSQSIYRHYIRPDADEDRVVRVTKLTGLVIIVAATGMAIYLRHSVVKAILDYFTIMTFIGIASAMGILWRRMNQGGVFTSLVLAAAAFVATRYVIYWHQSGLVASGLLSVAAD